MYTSYYARAVRNAVRHRVLVEIVMSVAAIDSGSSTPHLTITLLLLLLAAQTTVQWTPPHDQ